MKILIDNGHGVETKGKRSPDGQLKEYQYTRAIAYKITQQLIKLGYDAQLLVPEETDISLQNRVRRANEWCLKEGTLNVLLVSIHCNAAGMGQWEKASGWEAYTSVGQTRADELATLLYEEAKKYFNTKKIRTDFSDKDPDKEANFYILRKTKCPAVLTENFFMDNKDDMEFMLSSDGIDRIVKTHVEAIRKYTDKYGKN